MLQPGRPERGASQSRSRKRNSQRKKNICNKKKRSRKPRNEIRENAYMLKSASTVAAKGKIGDREYAKTNRKNLLDREKSVAVTVIRPSKTSRSQAK